MSGIVAAEHLRFDGGPRLQHPVIAAVAFGWPRTTELYDLKFGHRELVWFLSDLLGGARGPFAHLVFAIAEAEAKHFNLTEDLEVSIEDDGFPEWWKLKETAEPVLEALARALASMQDMQTVEEWEESR